jgi:hypothetical protein
MAPSPPLAVTVAGEHDEDRRLGWRREHTVSEEQMVGIVEAALEELGVGEPVLAAGQFQPRGHTGSLFAGGLLGDTLAGALGGAAGSLGGAHLHDAASGLPASMLVGVTATHVCGFAAATRHSAAGPLVFRVPRERVEVEVHQRVNVRVLELVDPTTGARIELEGSRVPLTHSKDVVDALRG